MSNENDQLGWVDLHEAFNTNSPQPLALQDVKRIDVFWTDDSSEPSFAWLLELEDGRWAAASGWTDYTGWDCQSGFSIQAYPTREDAIRLGLTGEHRVAMGLQ